MAATCSKITIICTISTLLAAFCSAANPAAAAPGVDCSSLVLNMADCLTFVTAGSTVKKPERTCCAGLKTVLKTDSDCLCEAFRNSAQLGVTLNLSKAMTLPKACHDDTPPSAANCTVNIGTGAAPAEAPNAVSPSLVPGAPSTGIVVNGVSSSVPVNSRSSSGASSLLAPIVLVVLGSSLSLFLENHTFLVHHLVDSQVTT